MTDTLGSVLASFTNAPNTATLKGNQVYGPYGNSRYSQGTINTFKGFTGQYNDSLTGLDYYHARYYDPVAGVFLSADVKQGNMQGVNPYAYVNGNPETNNDPTGLRPLQVCPSGDCNIPVDMAAVSADNLVWSGIATGSPYKVGPALTSGPSLTSVATGAPPSLYKSGSVLQTPLSSCGVSQNLCGQYGVHFAAYIDGIQFSVPGEWCVECGQPGGRSGNSGDSTGSNDLAASSNSGSVGNDDQPSLSNEEYALLEQERSKLGLGPIGTDKNTVAILFADDKMYTGTNGGDWNDIKLTNLSRSGIHGEIDALNQLFIDRQAAGTSTNGGGIMIVDREPCGAYCVTPYGNGNIPKAVTQSGLSYLQIKFPGGSLMILPMDLWPYIG